MRGRSAIVEDFRAAPEELVLILPNVTRESRSREVLHAGHTASSSPADLAVAFVPIPGSTYRPAKYSSSIRWRKT